MSSEVAENSPSAVKRPKLEDGLGLSLEETNVNIVKISENGHSKKEITEDASKNGEDSNGKAAPENGHDEDEEEVSSGKVEVGNSESVQSVESVEKLNKDECKVIEENPWFSSDDKRREAARKCWESGEALDDDSLKLYQLPFRHGEIKDFVNNSNFLDAFRTLFSKVEFNEKHSDLFQFNQSDDLNAVVDPHVFAISEYLKERVLPFLKDITGLPLNQTIDMFLSKYRQTDYLLCHDDELDSRRIAFIWYLSDDWKEDYGGTLDLFSATDSFHPDKIEKKIVPKCNNFVFFEVGVTSFHQVSEVLAEGKERLALSGWFYGEPLPRPTVQLPVDKSFNVLESVKDVNGILKKLCADAYLNSDIYSEINEQLTEESEVLIPGFLRNDTYEAICKSIVDGDLSKSLFTQYGPPNIAHYDEALIGPSSGNNDSSTSSEESTPSLDSLRELFFSKEFLNVLESITEFPFTTCDVNRVTSSLQKFSHGSYTLLRSGGTKQTGNKPVPDELDEEPEEEPNLIDVMFFFANKWEEKRGGSVTYLTTEGEQLITVPPNGNCLALVVRSPNVNSYTSYINCHAQEDVYFVYKMTFAFDGSI